MYLELTTKHSETHIIFEDAVVVILLDIAGIAHNTVVVPVGCGNKYYCQTREPIPKPADGKTNYIQFVQFVCFLMGFCLP